MFLFICILIKILKNTILIETSNFRLRKTCVLTSHAKFLLDLETAKLRTQSCSPEHLLEWTEVENSRWRPKPDVDTAKRLSPFPHLIATRFQRLYLCFRGRPNQWDMYLYQTTKLGGNRKWKTQDGGLHPWNAYISAPRLASHAILTAILLFLGRPYEWDMYLHRTTKLGGNREWKIQDGGLHSWNAYISAPRLASNAIPTAIPMFSESAIPMGHISIPYD